MMMRGLRAAALLLLCAGTGQAQEGAGPLDLAEAERLADIARDGADPQITASIVDESGRANGRTTPTPPVMVSRNGDPLFVYTRGAFFAVPEGRPEFVMHCRDDGIIGISVLVARIGEPWEELQQETDYELHVSAYGRTGRHILPVRVTKIYPSHELIARVDGTASPDGPLLQWMGRTSNLSYQLRQDGEVMRENGRVVSLTGGIDLSTFGSNVGPLIEHCRKNGAPLDASEPAVVAAEVPAPRDAPAESSQDPDVYLRALENCMVLPSQMCIHRLAGLTGPESNGAASDDTDNLAAYLAAYSGPAEAVLDATLQRHPDKPDVARLFAGSILAEVGRTDEALSVLGEIETPFPVQPGEARSIERRRFEAAYLNVAEWMVARGAPLQGIIAVMLNGPFSLDESARLVGVEDKSKLDLVEILMRDPDAPFMIEMFAHMEDNDEVNLGRAWAISFALRQNPITATPRSVADAIKAANPPEYGERHARELMVSRMSAVGNVVYAYLLAKNTPPAFRSRRAVHVDVLFSMGRNFSSEDTSVTSAMVRWSLDRAMKKAGSMASLANELATIGGALRDAGQAEATTTVETSEGLIRINSVYPDQARRFFGEHVDAYGYVHALGASGWERRALRLVHDRPDLDRRKALVVLLRGMSARERGGPKATGRQ